MEYVCFVVMKITYVKMIIIVIIFLEKNGVGFFLKGNFFFYKVQDHQLFRTLTWMNEVHSAQFDDISYLGGFVVVFVI